MYNFKACGAKWTNKAKAQAGRIASVEQYNATYLSSKLDQSVFLIVF